MQNIQTFIENTTGLINYENQLSIQINESSSELDVSSSAHSSSSECTPIKKVAVSPCFSNNNSSSVDSSFRDEIENEENQLPKPIFNTPSFASTKQKFNSTPLFNQSLVKIVKRKPTVNFHSIDDIVNGGTSFSSCNDSGVCNSYQSFDSTPQIYNQNDEQEDKENLSKSNNKLDNKKYRTTFSEEQKKQLDFYFNQNPYPDPRETEDMSAHLGLPENVIKVWFQNKRSRDKQRKFSRENNSRVNKTNQFSTNNTNEQPLNNASPLIVNLQLLTQLNNSFKAAAALQAFANNNRNFSHF